ncbi:CPBP family intramembrane metalloprotease [Micrococcales bacterium 31B]|nr:CPBP family intramembrane metalloprotease [Micrococcales bacterium 31B]
MKTLREVTISLSVGLMVIARVYSPAAVLFFASIIVFAARRISSRVALGSLGILIAFGLPWIATSLISGLIWLLLAKREHSSPRLPSIRLNAKNLVLVVGLGLLFGLIAVPIVNWQLMQQPIQIDVARPATGWLVAAVLVFSLANSIGEELIWRGALLSESSYLTFPVTCLVQIVSFGVAHYYGLPGGLIGCCTTGVAALVFLLAHRRWGLSATIAVHFIADAIIFAAAIPTIIFTGWCVGSCGVVPGG